MKQGTKMPPRIGDDGRLYYNYNVGLRVKMQENGETWELEIVNATYINGTEYYTVLRNCAYMPAQLSANRVRFLLSVCGRDVIRPGAPRELPLLPEEVQNSYEAMQECWDEEIVKLAKCEEYSNVRTKINKLSFKIGMIEARGEDGAEELKKELEDLEIDAQRAMLNNGINTSIINRKQCPHCGDKGFTRFGICDCAYAQAEEIKEFNAQIRLKARKYQA